MALSIISNFAANVAHRYLNEANTDATDSLTRLSSGRRVVSARDDAASLAIGSRLNAEVRSLSVATTNASQANSMLQIADGALATVNTMLIRMKQLAVQGSSANLSATERSFVFDEFKAIRSEIDRIANDTEFNGNKLLAGTTAFGTETADFNAGGTAESLVGSNGFASFSFETDAPNVQKGNDIKLKYDSGTATFTATNTATGKTQSIDFAGQTGTEANNKLNTALNGLIGTGNTTIAGTNITKAAGNSTADADKAKVEQALNLLINDSRSPLNAEEKTWAQEALKKAKEGGADLQAVVNAARGAAAKAAEDAGRVSKVARGDTRELSFSEFGLKVTLNDAFQEGRDLDPDAATGAASTTFTVQETVKDTSLTYRIGTGATAAEDELTFTLGQANVNSLNANLQGVEGFSTITDAENAISYVADAIDVLQSARATIGTGQNRLGFAQQNLRSSMENNEAARSILIDLDVASEMTKFTSRQILVQSGVSMLSQANQMPQNLLRLLQS